MTNIDNIDIIVYPYNAIFIQIKADKGIIGSISRHFSFKIENAHFNPLVKNKQWDGIIRVLKPNNLLYFGLLNKLIQYAKDNDLSIFVDKSLICKSENIRNVLNEWYKTKKISNIIPRDLQFDALEHVVNNNRSLIVSPTGSGKSFIIYLILKWFDKKALLIVPNIDLTRQMRDDLISYGYDPNEIHQIFYRTRKEL